MQRLIMQQFIMRQKMSSSLSFWIFKILARIRIKKKMQYRCATHQKRRSCKSGLSRQLGIPIVCEAELYRQRCLYRVA